MGDNILINGVQVDLNPPGTESVTRVSLNRRVDDMVQVTRAFTRTIDRMALNFHGAYDKHVDELESCTQDLSEKIVDLKDQNTELVKANQDVEMKFQVAEGEIAGLIQTIAELNEDKKNLETDVNETSAKYRRFNENVNNLLNVTRSIIANIAVRKFSDNTSPNRFSRDPKRVSQLKKPDTMSLSPLMPVGLTTSSSACRMDDVV